MWAAACEWALERWTGTDLAYAVDQLKASKPSKEDQVKQKANDDNLKTAANQ